MPAGNGVGEAEMDPEIDARLDDVVGNTRETRIRARQLDGQSHCAVDVEREWTVVIEEQLQRAHEGGSDTVRARRVIGVRRIVNEWPPVRVASGSRVAVVVPLDNRC